MIDLNSIPESSDSENQQEQGQEQGREHHEINDEKSRGLVPRGYEFKSTEEMLLCKYVYSYLVDYKWRELLPSGFRFKPTDQELIRYLHSKLIRLPIRHGLIANVNVYEYHPGSLSEMAYDSGDEVMYFFTELKRKYPNGKRPSRSTTTGDGYWRTNGKTIDITVTHSIDSETADKKEVKIMGTKRTLVYIVGKQIDFDTNRTNWIMREYKIHDVQPSTSELQDQLNDYVVCSIYCKEGRKQLEEEGTEETEGEEEELENEEIDEDDNVLNTTKRIRRIIVG